MFHYLPIVLICAVSTPPQDCTSETALDVHTAAPVANLFECLRGGEVYGAGTTFGPRSDQEYQKNMCQPTE